MKKETLKKVRKLNLEWHRDLGYFFSGLIIMYCISGIALNHVNEWNSDFIIEKKNISFVENLSKANITEKTINDLNNKVGETEYKLFDFPTNNQMKIYYDNATLHLNFETKTGIYETVYRRPVFYQTNVLHKNSLKGWKWFSDVFAVLLIVITITGIFIAKGKNGILGRGKWLLALGLLPPLLAIVIHALL